MTTETHPSATATKIVTNLGKETLATKISNNDNPLTTITTSKEDQMTFIEVQSKIENIFNSHNIPYSLKIFNNRLFRITAANGYQIEANIDCRNDAYCTIEISELASDKRSTGYIDCEFYLNLRRNVIPPVFHYIETECTMPVAE